MIRIHLFTILVIGFLLCTIFMVDINGIGLGTEAQAFFDSVPEEDRELFIAFHVNAAVDELGRNDVHIIPQDSTIPTEQYNKFKDMNAPENFSKNLLDWIENDFKDKPAFEESQNGGSNPAAVCFPSGCVDPQDIGQLCCPF